MRRAVDAETLGMETAEDFTPYTVAHLGIPFHLKHRKGGSSLLLFSIKKGERLNLTPRAGHDGGEKSFQIEAIVPSGNRLYVAERHRASMYSVAGTVPSPA